MVSGERAAGSAAVATERGRRREAEKERRREGEGERGDMEMFTAQRRCACC
jgi:hypothetical protein